MKAIVITGSSRGLGFEMARIFLEKGHCVTISGQDDGNLEEAVRKLENYKEQLLAVKCEVTKTDELQNLWNKSSEKWGKVDIWINNAGVSQMWKDLCNSEPEEFNRVFKINFFASVSGTQIAARGMLVQGYGDIYNTEGFGSDGAVMKGLNIYGTTKRAINYVSRAFAAELQGSGVHVGLVSPGMMATDFIKEDFFTWKIRMLPNGFLISSEISPKYLLNSW